MLDVLSLGLLPLSSLFPIAENSELSENLPALMVALLLVGVGVITVIVNITTIVLFLMWLYRAHKNLPAFGFAPHTLQYSAGWAVGSFFVPFVSLIVPYRAIRELWRKSVPNSSLMFSEQSPPAFFPVWWAFWIASNIANQISLRLTLSGADESSGVLVVEAIAGFLDLIAALLAIKVVKEIDRQQTASSALIPREAQPARPPMPPPSFQPADIPQT